MPSDVLKSLAKEALMMPQEKLQRLGSLNKKLFIGIPKETSFQENRVSLVPEAVSLLVNNGHRVCVESNAGKNANFQDKDYSEVGGEICYSTEEVFKADIIIKVAPPTKEEIGMMPGNQTLFAAIQLSVHPKNTLELLMKKKITAIAWDFIKDEEDVYPVIRSMSEIAGIRAISIASQYMSNLNEGRGTILGGIAGVSPTEVVIIGAGTVGEFAAKSAIGLGASVKIFDNNIYKLRRLQNDLKTSVWTSIVNPKVLEKALMRADVAIGALRSVNGRTPCVVSEDMVAKMKEGAIVVDVSIDQGGCFETSRVTNHNSPTFVENGVIHYCVPNIASSVSRTASFALSNIFSPLLLDIANGGGIGKKIKEDRGFRHGVYVYKGTLTSKTLGDAFSLPFKNIELLLMAL
ncbi:alanine dehydrogenase [Flavobacteriales bacterium]|nr:alanine dehydrogenase [Flavobacteriales bacterium]MDB4088997.1 alanine dehydrogenase [Flavobacteriales bacterium]